MRGLTAAEINILITARDEASAAMSKIGIAAGKMSKAIKTAAKIGAVAILALGVASLKAAIDFESAFAGVRKTVDATEAEFDVLRQGIRDMAKELPASAVSIAAVAEAAGQLGIETQNILGFTRTMIDLGETTNLSATEAATALARLANITKLPQDQFDQLGSTIVALGNNFATTEAEIVEMGLRLAGAGAQIGLTEAQILSMAAALTSLGINAEAGGTSFSRIMLDMSKAVATGNEDLATFAQVAGQSVDEFARLFREDASGAIVAFMDGMAGLDQAALFGILEQLGFDNVRVRDAILRTAGSEGILADALSLGTQAWADNTALTEEAEQRYNTMASQISILRNNVVDLMIDLGDALTPALRAVNEALIDAMPAIKKFLKDGIERASKAFKELRRDLEPVIEFLGKFIDKKDQLIIAGSLIGVALAAIAAGFVVITVAATAAFIAENAALLGIPALIALVVAAVVILSRHWDDFGIVMENIADVAVAALKFILAGAELYFFPMIEAAKVAIALFQGDWGKAWGIIQDIPGRAMQAIRKVFDKGMDLLRSAAGRGFTAIANTIMSAIWPAIKFIADGIDKLISGLNKINLFKDIPKINLGDFAGFGAQAGGAFTEAFNDRAGRDLLRNVDADIMRAMNAAMPAIEDAGSSTGDALGSAAGATAATAIEKALTDRERWEAAGRELADALASGLRGGTTTMTEAVTAMFSFMDALPAKFSDIAAGVGSVIGQFEAATAAAQNLFDTVAERGRVTFDDIANLVGLGAFDMAQDFLDAMEGRSSDIGAAIFQHTQEEAAKAAKDAADEFRSAFADIEGMFAGIAGTISGLTGATSVEGAIEGAKLARLRLLALLKEQEVLKEQAQAVLVITNLEKQIAELRRLEAIDVERMTAEIEAQQVVIEGIEAQMDAVRAAADIQLNQLDTRIDAARAYLDTTKAAARAAISEIDAALRVTRKETSVLIREAEAEARAAVSAASSILGDLERALQRLEADLATAIPEDGARSIRDIMSDIDRAGVLRRPGLLRELELAKQANLERQDQIATEIEAQRDIIADAEKVAAIQIAAAEKQLAVAEAAAEAHKEMWATMIAEAQAQVDDLRTEQKLVRENLEIAIDLLEEQQELAETVLETLQENLDAYTDSIDAQAEAIEELIAMVEDHESVAARNLRALRDQIAELELSAEIRRLERDLVAAHVLASNELLKTDAEVLEAIGDQTTAYSNLASALDILRDNTLDMYDAAVLAQLGFSDLAAIIGEIVAGITPSGEVGALSEFHAGGIVPGPTGSPQVIMAQGGEAVFTQGQLKALLAQGGRPIVVNVYPREINIHGDTRETLADLGAGWATEAVQ